jgi:hypothetical protein
MFSSLTAHCKSDEGAWKLYIICITGYPCIGAHKQSISLDRWRALAIYVQQEREYLDPSPLWFWPEAVFLAALTTVSNSYPHKM